MTMTKRDFENLAKDLRWFRLATKEWQTDPDFQDAFTMLIRDIEDTCKTANTRFNPGRFEAAIYREVET